MQIRVNLRRFFMESATFMLLWWAMAADEEERKGLGGNAAGSKPVDRYEPEHSRRDPRTDPRPPPAWEDDDRARPLGLVITAALLFVLFAAAVLFGGHGSFGTAGQPRISGPDGKALGDILYSMQPAASCPPSSFDNATGSVAGRAPEHCPSRDSGEASHPHQWNFEVALLIDSGSLWP
jgi:hypothetical protein